MISFGISIDSFVVSNSMNHMKEIEGIKVIEIENLIGDNNLILIGVSTNEDDIVNYLINKGFPVENIIKISYSLSLSASIN